MNISKRNVGGILPWGIAIIINVKNLMVTNSYDISADLSRLIKGAGIIFFGSVFGSFVNYLYNIYIARTLGPEPYGLYYLSLYVFNIIAIISLLGMNQAILRYVSLYNGTGRDDKIKGTIKTGTLLVLVISCLSSSILFFLSDIIAITCFNKIQIGSLLRIFAIGIPFICISNLFMYATQAVQIMKYRAYIKEILEPLSKFFFSFIFLFLGWQLIGLLRAFVISLIISAVLFSYYLLKIFPQIRLNIKHKYNFKELLCFSVPLIPVDIFRVITHRIEALMLGHFRSPHEVGLYCVVSQTSGLISLILMSFNAIFAPMISDMYNKRQFLRLGKLFKIVTRWVFTIAFPIVLIMVFFSKEILIIFGDKFKAASSCLIILSLGQFAHSSTGPVAFMLTMSGQSLLMLINACFILFLRITFNIFLIPKFGLQGAAVAGTISTIILNLAMSIQVFYLLKMHPYKISFFKPLLSGAFAILFIYFIKININTVSFKIFIILLLLFIILYTTLLCLFGFRDEDKIVFNLVKKKLGV